MGNREHPKGQEQRNTDKNQKKFTMSDYRDRLPATVDEKAFGLGYLSRMPKPGITQSELLEAIGDSLQNKDSVTPTEHDKLTQLQDDETHNK